MNPALIKFTKEVEEQYFQGCSFEEAFAKVMEAHGVIVK